MGTAGDPVLYQIAVAEASDGENYFTLQALNGD
jgi:hypothetical protein